ncbi:recombination regulator RecX [Limosilactobacillus gastricus]|nr:recombination regulator RecX [Limosilactobacillus gastricus]
MKKITKIEAQKRPGRYNIYLNGQYAFPVAESVLIKYRLAKDLELDTATLEQITKDDQIAKAYGRMLDYLSHQLRTEAEVKQKLIDLETPPEMIDPVMEHLRSNRLLDDQVYADSYVRTVMHTELKGPQVIRQKLRQKGVGELVIDQALEQFDLNNQLENAQKLAQRLVQRYRHEPTRRQEEKVRQGLMTNGYSSDLYNQLKEDLVLVNDEDQQASLLATSGEKIWQRNRRYENLYERKMKTKQALYRKGFDLDAIDRWLAERDSKK